MSVGEILEGVRIILVFPSSIFSFSQAFAFHPSAEILHGRWPLHIGTSLCQLCLSLWSFLKGGIPNTMGFNMYKSWSTGLDDLGYHFWKPPYPNRLNNWVARPILWYQATWIDLTHLGNIVKRDVKLSICRVSAGKASLLCVATFTKFAGATLNVLTPCSENERSIRTGKPEVYWFCDLNGFNVQQWC